MKAIEKAEESMAKGGFPVSTVIVKDGKVIGSGLSLGGLLCDPTSHSDIASLREVCKNLNTTNLAGVTVYTSVEPCLMCFGASMWAGVSRISFACAKGKVSQEYYGGDYDTQEINKKLLRPIEITQIQELEEDSLSLVKKWEKLM